MAWAAPAAPVPTTLLSERAKETITLTLSDETSERFGSNIFPISHSRVHVMSTLEIIESSELPKRNSYFGHHVANVKFVLHSLLSGVVHVH